MKLDIICPIYFFNAKFFKTNVESWIRELPINRLLFGVNKNSMNLDFFREELQGINFIEINHEIYKTLGMCLADLMRRVETEWFVFIHSDVELTENCFLLMKSFMKHENGIIESERTYCDIDNNLSPSGTYIRDRAYSGFQIFQKKAISEFIEKIEDDYIYRNEDFIFKDIIEQNGYIYKKTWAMHYHQIIKTQRWSTPPAKTFEMQWKGLIKYATPSATCLDACLQAFKKSVKDFQCETREILSFARKINLEWYHAIFDYFLIELMNQFLFKENEHKWCSTGEKS